MVKNCTEQHFGYNESEYYRFKTYAWVYLIMFSLLYCCLYCTRLNISSATPYLVESGWTESTIGILTGTLFWTYGIGQLINGRLSEIFGPSKFVVMAVVFSIATNFLITMIPLDSVFILAVLWGLNGYFQSMGWTPGIAALTKWWPGNSRGFAIGFVNAFSGFGQVAAYLAVLVAFNWFWDWGWKAVFIIPALFPLAFLILFVSIVKKAPKDIGLKEYDELDKEKAKQEQEMRTTLQNKGELCPYKYILCNKKFLVWIIIAFSVGLARYGLSTWIPLFFQEQGFSSTASIASSLILPIGMGIGTLVVPWLSDHFCAQNRMPAAILSAIIGAVSTIAILFLDVQQVTHLLLVEFLLFVSGFCVYAINGIMFTHAADFGGRFFSGTCSGILNFFAYLGAAIQSIVYGFILRNGGWSVVFITITLFYLLIAFLGIGVIIKEKEVQSR